MLLHKRQGLGAYSAAVPGHALMDDNRRNERAVKAREIMTGDVVSVRADTPTRQIARLLLDKRISAVPVVDDKGAPIGMVSEGDLIGRDEVAREGRRDWWLALLAEGEPLDPGFLASVHAAERVARDVMSGPVVTVREDTDAGEIARLLQSYRIKRVPVLRDDRIVGIVSRADLVRALAEQPASVAPHAGGFMVNILAGIDAEFLHDRSDAKVKLAVRRPEPTSDKLEAGDFQKLAADFERQELQHRDAERRAAAEQRRRRAAQLIDDHVTDAGWRALLQQARRAAEHGEGEFMLLRFPSQLCSDGGRSINAPDPGWPATLRGDAAEIYLRWEQDLKPHGFRLAAKVLEFPDGVPGDVGLFLIWGS
jgi:CBS domain-containing protein